MRLWKLLLFFLLIQINVLASDFVVIGDSHSCGSFGQSLADQLISQGHQVTIYCAVSSSPYHWVLGVNPKNQKCKTYSKARPEFVDCLPNGTVPTLDLILKQHPYSHVLVSLGTNSLVSNSTDIYYQQMNQRLAAHTCSWVGPPHLNPSQSKGFPPGRVQKLENNLFDFYLSLNLAVTSCKIIDSRPYTEPKTRGNQTTDGVHRTLEAGRFWSMQVLNYLKFF
jgi:hypothetical protein